VFNDILGYVPEIISEAAGDLGDGVNYATGNRTAYAVPMVEPDYDRDVASYNKHYAVAEERGVLPWSHKTAYDSPLHEHEYLKDATALLVNGAVAVIAAAKTYSHIRPALAHALGLHVDRLDGFYDYDDDDADQLNGFHDLDE
jgi:hypothetical protein